MTNDASPDDGDRVSAVGFLYKIWEERLFIIVTILFFLALSEAYILHTPEKYTTTILVGHVTSVDSAPSASSSGGGGGLIALIGLGTGFSNDTKYNLFLTLIKTENFARLLQNKYHFDHPHSKTTVSSISELTGLLTSVVTLGTGDTTTLQLQMGDKEFAKQFLLAIYNEGNQAVRAIDTERAQKFAAFIEDRFRSENSRPMQDALGSLLVNQERFLMVTSVNLPYAVQLLDGPTASDDPTSPKTTLLREVGFAVGFGVSIFVILIWEAIASERRGRGLRTPGPSQWIINSPRDVKRFVQKLLGGGRPSATPDQLKN